MRSTAARGGGPRCSSRSRPVTASSCVALRAIPCVGIVGAPTVGMRVGTAGTTLAGMLLVGVLSSSRIGTCSGVDPDAYWHPGPVWMRPRLHYAPLNKSAGDIAGALSHNGLHHVWQLTGERLGAGAGWHHRVSADLVHWRTASDGQPVGPDDWPSGFAIADSEQTGGRICAGMRCDRCQPKDPSRPLCPLGKDNTSACQQPPLALRCATNSEATEWGAYEPLIPIVYYRGIPYDPFRPFRDHDGWWYAGIAVDACNGTTDAVPCSTGGAIAMWRSPALRGAEADWQQQAPILMFANNHSIYPGPMSQHGLMEFVTIDFFGSLPGDPNGTSSVVSAHWRQAAGYNSWLSCAAPCLGYVALELSRCGWLIPRSLLVGEYRVIFNNCYDCRGSTEYFIGKQRNGSEFHIECGSPQATPAC